MLRVWLLVGLAGSLLGCAGKATSGEGNESGGLIEAGGQSPADSGATSSGGTAGSGGVPGQTCGGIIGSTCAADEYCAYVAGQLCGAADATATCQPIPKPPCLSIAGPVCGCDYKPYGNTCEAAKAGTGVLNSGACPSLN